MSKILSRLWQKPLFLNCTTSIAEEVVLQVVQGGWAFPKIMKIVIVAMMIDEDKTKILIVMMLCKGGRSAASAGRPTQPNRCQCVIDLGLLLFHINPFKPLKIMFYCCPSFKIFGICSFWRPVEVSSYFSKYVLLHQPFICTLWSLSPNV